MLHPTQCVTAGGSAAPYVPQSRQKCMLLPRNTRGNAVVNGIKSKMNVLQFVSNLCEHFCMQFVCNFECSRAKRAELQPNSTEQSCTPQAECNAPSNSSCMLPLSPLPTLSLSPPRRILNDCCIITHAYTHAHTHTNTHTHIHTALTRRRRPRDMCLPFGCRHARRFGAGFGTRRCIECRAVMI